MKDRPWTTGPGAADIYGQLAEEARAEEYELAVEYRARLIRAGDDGDMESIIEALWRGDYKRLDRLYAEMRRLLTGTDNDAVLEAATGLQELLSECAEQIARERMEYEAKRARNGWVGP